MRSLELQIQLAVEECRQTSGLLLDPGSCCLSELAQRFDFYEKLFVFNFVRPNAGNCAIDKHDRRDPALVAVYALIVLRAEQMVFLAMGEQVGIEDRQQADARSSC